ncbi:hypothetical protein FGG08_000172 [Glutinoglossum americanum]|uniref:Uncharacterized protein n=1 Tax=Glutinoglossum americanum TaxID=1670608 RepID=A0A9P8L693_9PEZI|nr:hypothetical protein FGG08_000172 [Glutinoglossum americanum]
MTRKDATSSECSRLSRRTLRHFTGFLRACRQVSREACAVLYGSNHFHLFTTFSDDIRSFLEKIGESNRRSIRSLKIDWVHGVRECTDEGGVLDIIETLDETRNAACGGANPFWDDIFGSLLRYKTETVLHIRLTLELLARGHGLKELALVIPGRDACKLRVDRYEEDTKRERYDMKYFGWELLLHHRELQLALESIRGLEKLSIGHTVCLGRMEQIARKMGVTDLTVTWTASEGQDYGFPDEVIHMVQDEGWDVELEAYKAHKLLSGPNYSSSGGNSIAWWYCSCDECL